MKSNYRSHVAKAAMAIALAMLMAMAQRAAAQGSPGAGDRGRGMGDRLSTELNLTADQQAKINKIMEQNRASMKALRDDQSLSQDQRKEKLHALRESMRKEMDAVLTPEQQQKMATLRESRGGMGGDPGERLTKELNLTADQQSKMKSIMETTHQQMRAIEDNQSLSKQDKHAKIQQLHESTKSQISALLTPEQQQKFAQMHERMGPGGHGGHRRGGPGGQPGSGQAEQPPPPPPSS